MFVLWKCINSHPLKVRRFKKVHFSPVCKEFLYLKVICPGLSRRVIEMMPLYFCRLLNLGPQGAIIRTSHYTEYM